MTKYFLLAIIIVGCSEISVPELAIKYLASFRFIIMEAPSMGTTIPDLLLAIVHIFNILTDCQISVMSWFISTTYLAMSRAINYNY